MKYRLPHFIPAMIAVAVSGLAHGHSSSELTIKGEITPAACGLSLSQAMVDLGTHSYSSLHPTWMTILPTVEVQMNIVCDSPVSAAFQASNNRRSSNMEKVEIAPGQIPIRTLGSSLGYAMGGRSAVGLGFAVENDPRTKLGAVEMALDLDRMVVDGENLTAKARAMAFNTRLDTSLPSNVQTYSNSMVPLPGPVWNVMQRLPSTEGSVLARYRSLSVPIVLMPGLAPNSALPANQELKLDGSITFGLHYF